MRKIAAQAMERLERTGDCPDVEALLRSHLQETGKQLRRLERSLEECREAESALNDLALATLANLSSLAHATARHEILITDY
jgi:ferritin-like metal-binding protein YciE